MIKAVLRYTDCLQDGRNVYTVLTKNKIPIVGTRLGWTMFPRVIVLLNDYNQLNNILFALNANCHYEVRLVRSKTLMEE